MDDIIFGKNAVMEALISGNREINKILISKNIHSDNKIEKINIEIENNLENIQERTSLSQIETQKIKTYISTIYNVEENIITIE